MYLRQSTASQVVVLGRYVDSTDGNTEKTALSIANTDIKIWKEGATTLASKNSGGATHIANGVYYCTLDATDTNTLGKLEIHTHLSGALATKCAFLVLASAVYDALLGTTALATATNITSASGVSLASSQTFNMTGSITGNLSGSVGSVAGNVGGNVAGSVGSVTAGVTVSTNSDKTGYALTSGERTSVADALLNRDMSAVSDTNSRSPLNALRFLRNKWSASGTTLTVTKEDDSTSAWTSALTTDASATPITGSDPA